MIYEREIFNMIIAILLFALIAFLSIDLIVAGLQLVFIIIWLPFIIIYQLIKEYVKIGLVQAICY